MEYTKEITKYLDEEYSSAPDRATVARLAAEFSVSERSIIGKLVSMGIYQTPQRTTKSGHPVELKSEIAQEIADMFGLEIPSLVKAEREHLRELRNALRNPDNLRALLVDYAEEN